MTYPGLVESNRVESSLVESGLARSRLVKPMSGDVPGSRLKGAGQGIDRARFIRIRQTSQPKSATAGPSANPRNLMGFLDAFKAVPRFSAGSADGPAPSLTACEDFA
jgi:hypothetical protein